MKNSIRFLIRLGYQFLQKVVKKGFKLCNRDVIFFRYCIPAYSIAHREFDGVTNGIRGEMNRIPFSGSAPSPKFHAEEVIGMYEESVT
jgi:hypothetical protein